MSLQGQRRTRRRAAVLLVLSVLLAACGSRLSDDQQAALATSAAGPGQIGAVGGTTGTGSGPAGGDGASTTTAATGQTTGGGAPASDPGTDPAAGGDTAPDPNAPAGAGGEEGATCGGGGDADVGVTAEHITLGNVSTISGPIPGFGQTGVNGVKAYVNFVNATGGVCGRQLRLLTADDRLQSGTNKSETDKLMDQVLGFVGSTTVVDDGAAQSITGTNVAYTGLAISEAMIKSPNNFPVSPIDLADGGNGALAMFRYFKETEGISKAALVWPAQASAKARMDGYRTDFERAGVDIVVEREVAVTETNYSGVAQNIESAGADIVVTTLEISGMANLAKSMEQNGYFPKVPMYGAQAYGRNFLVQAGSAGEPTVLGLSFAMLEDASSLPPMQDFITWYERTNPGADIDFFAIQTWIAADLYVSALRKVSGPPTRDKVLAALKTFTEYDAKGMIAPVNPVAKKGSGCFLIARVEGGSWVRDHPSQGFDCSYR